MSTKKPSAPPPAPTPSKKAIPRAPTPKDTSPEAVAEVFKPSKNRRLKIFFITAASLVVLILAATTAYAFYYSSRYYPKTYVAGVDIGGMNQTTALAAVTAKENAFLNSKITLTNAGKNWTVVPKDIQSSFANQSLLDTVWARQKGGDIRSQLRQLGKGLIVTQKYEPDFTLSSTAGMATLQKSVFSQAETSSQETALNFSTNPVSVVAGKAGTRVNQIALASAMYAAFANGSTTVPLTLTPFQPEVTPAMAVTAINQAEALLQKTITVQLGATSKTETISSSTLATWLTTSVAPDGTGLQLGLQQPVVAGAIATWAKDVAQPAQNAQLQHDSSGAVSVAVPDKPGQALNQDATYTALLQLVQSATPPTTITAPVDIAPATVRVDNYISLGLVNVVGTDTTNFSNSPTNRITNITRGQTLLNGILVPVGSTFSTIKNLGDIDSAHGFVPELVILGKTLVDQDGGGLCQVSTTLFRATLNAGLNITERQNHSFRVGYYEVGTGPGLDATIYDPQPDFQWKNDMAQDVYVQSYIKGNNLTFDIYGTSDGRVATIGKPQILSTTPVGAPEYIQTPSLPTGTTKQIEHAVDGAKVTVTYSVVRNGQSLENRTFVSNYEPWPAQYEVGTGPAPATPTPSPAQ